MKKSLIALAALTAFAGAASAQSSVTLFGIVDAAYAHVSAGGKSASGITNSGLNSSRLGFRGVEDMGGGLRAGFWLEAQLSNETGTVGGGNNLNANQGQLVAGSSVLGSTTTTQLTSNGLGGAPAAFFNRRSTVSLFGNFGEIRIGRDYTPHFWNTTFFDPFGTNGIGQSLTPAMLVTAGVGPGTLAPLPAATLGSGAANSNNAVRANNTIGYFLPGNLGGFGGQFMVGFGEKLSNAANKSLDDYFGFRLTYGAGPLSLAYGYGNSKGNSGNGNVKYNNLAGSFDLGSVKPMAQWAQEKQQSGAKVTGWLIGVTVPLGQGEFRTAYSDYNLEGVNATVNKNDWKKFAIGYGYNLSKRTQLYATYAKVSNDGAATVSVANNGLSAGGASAGGSSTGYEMGIRHAF